MNGDSSIIRWKVEAARVLYYDNGACEGSSVVFYITEDQVGGRDDSVALNLARMECNRKQLLDRPRQGKVEVCLVRVRRQRFALREEEVIFSRD